VRLGAIIALLDATRPLLAGRGPAAAERQVGLADLVVINKVDRVGPAEVMACRRLMRRANPRARVVEAIQASVAVDVVEMLTRGRGEGPLPAGHPDAAHDHGPVHALVVPLPRPLDRDAFEAWLRALPPAVMRAKGFVRLAASAHLFAFQHVAGTWALGRVETRRPPATLAVLIGTALDEDGLRRGLAACAVPAPDLVGARAAEG
jgi:G3E family GTPase